MYVCMYVCMYVYIPCSSLASPPVQETRWRSSASACLQFLGTSRTQLRHRDALASPLAPGLRQPRNSARWHQQSRGLGINSENFSVLVHLPYKGQYKMDFSELLPRRALPNSLLKQPSPSRALQMPRPCCHVRGLENAAAGPAPWNAVETDSAASGTTSTATRAPALRCIAAASCPA